MIPEVVTRAVVAEEIAAVHAWAARRPGWTVDYNETTLHIMATAHHPVADKVLLVDADLHGYRAVAPAWRFLNPETEQPDGAPFPQPGQRPGITGSIFHSNRLLCAPWNRLAYSESGGVHGDWGALTNWQQAAAGYTKADTLADMLCQIDLHLAVSPGILL